MKNQVILEKNNHRTVFKGYYWAKCTFYPNFKTAIMAIKSLNPEIM